jgi:peptidoglycan/xylan/chitin deacetylase (PgdA/CDA1 family)
MSAAAKPARPPWRVLLGMVVVIALGTWGAVSYSVYRFPGLEGPQAPTRVIARPPARIADFAGGSPHRLAVLITDPASDWLGLARGLRAHGIPFTFTTDPAEALRHRAIYVYPTISGRLMAPAVLRALAAHVRGGGGLLAYNIEGGGLEELFGVEAVPIADHADWLAFNDHPTLPDGGVRFSRAGTEAAFDALTYKVTNGFVKAAYADHRPALVCGRVAGSACVLGLDLGRLTARALNGRVEAAARAYVNSYEPSLDLLYRWLADFYVAAEPMPWLVDTAPAGHEFSILLTHDVDFSLAVSSARFYAQQLGDSGTRGTFFIQTKYIRDYNDDVFFTARSVPELRGLAALGMEIGSHTVAHSNAFKLFRLGSGEERYPWYLPFVTSQRKAFNASILGELRVSKYLLGATVGAPVDSFRSGYLSNPFHLPEGLAATGYRYDSSITANASLTHLPFQLTTAREDRSLEPVWEIPVTIEDEEGELARRLDTAYQVIGKVARDRGLVVIQIHPDVRSAKLAFEKRVIADWRGRAWFATLSEFGDWWRARDLAAIDVDGAGGAWRLVVGAAVPVERLRIVLPKARLAGVQAAPGLVADGQAVAVNRVAGSAALSWRQ